jgi:hypothetical protein
MANLGKPTPEQLINNALSALIERIKKGEIERNGYEVELVFNQLKDQYKASPKKLQAKLDSLLPPPEQPEQVEAPLDLPIEPDAPFTSEEKQAAEELLKTANLFEEFHKDFALTNYKADRTLTDDGLLLLGRTLLPTSSGEYGHGKLATGKSEFYFNVARFFPLARTLTLTTFSEKFLFYAGGPDGKALQGFLVVLGESDFQGNDGGDTFKQKYWRQLLTENRITQGTVEPENRRNKAYFRILYGPITSVVTGVDSPSRFDSQTSSRLYCRHFTHTHASIKAILAAKAQAGSISANPKPEDSTELHKAHRKWRCMFTMLRKFDPADPLAIQAVKIPYLEQLIFKKTRHTESDLRAFDRLKEAITVSALLHQANRDIDSDNVLETTWQDYLNIKASFLTSVPNVQDLSNDLITRFVDELLPWWQTKGNEGRKTRTEIARALNANRETAKSWITAWDDAGLLICEKDGEHNTATHYYQPATQAKELAEQIRSSADLGIKDISHGELSHQVVDKSQSLAADESSGLVGPENTEHDRVTPSSEPLVACSSSVSLGGVSIHQAEMYTGPDYPDAEKAWCVENAKRMFEGQAID